MKPITVLLADDHPIVLHGLEQLLAGTSSFSVVGRCARGDEVVPSVRRLDPDLLLLDVRMPGQDGFAVLEAVRAEGLRTRIVLLSAVLDERDVVRALRLGASGVVLKDTSPEELIGCLRKAHAGGTWVQHDLLTAAAERMVRHEAGLQEATRILTPRELEIALMVAQGLHNKEVGARLGISEGTVKIHLHSVYEKLKLNGRAELVGYVHSKALL